MGPIARCSVCVAVCAVTVGGVFGASFTEPGAYADLKPSFPMIERVDARCPQGVVGTEDIRYAGGDGDSRMLDIYLMPSAQALPAVLIVHGGGWDVGSRQMERPLAYAFALRGYAAIPVGYRLGAAGRFPAALHDLKTAVRFVRSHAREYGIDPGRIFAVGASAGGQLVLLLGATNGALDYEGPAAGPPVSSQVNAVVDIDGLADFTSPDLVAQQAAKPSAPTRFLGGSYADRPGLWRQASPRFQITPASAPVLFLNSTAPSPLLPGRPETAQALEAFGIPTRTVVLPGTPHPFWLFHPWFEQVVAEADQFLMSSAR